jgi:hypothetical protein
MQHLPKQSTNITQQVQAEPILKVIRRKCIDCSADQLAEVRNCPVNACALWPYRMGENPFARPRGLSFSTQTRLQKKPSQTAANIDGNEASERGWRVAP